LPAGTSPGPRTRATNIDPVEVERIWTDAQQLGDNLRRSGVGADAVEIRDDAPLQERLLAHPGRDPR
jgi:hypothetical protein